MKLTHPATGQVIEVGAGSAPMYESQGWTRTRPAAKPASAKPAAGATNKKEKSNGKR